MGRNLLDPLLVETLESVSQIGGNAISGSTNWKKILFNVALPLILALGVAIFIKLKYEKKRGNIDIPL